jgi:hypothetical protein
MFYKTAKKVSNELLARSRIKLTSRSKTHAVSSCEVICGKGDMASQESVMEEEYVCLEEEECRRSMYSYTKYRDRGRELQAVSGCPHFSFIALYFNLTSLYDSEDSPEHIPTSKPVLLRCPNRLFATISDRGLN